MDNKILLKVYKPADERRCVQISAAANAKLMEIYRATGLSLGYIVSQMIIQGADLIEIVEAKEDE